jgi:hypothetical protein
MVAQVKSQRSSQIGSQSTLANGSRFCLPQKSVLQYKRQSSNKMVQRLKAVPDNEIIEAIIYRLEKCNEKHNLWVGEDLHTADGECFKARGHFSGCNSRFCSQCVSRPSRRNAKKAQYVLNRLNRLNLRFIVLTMPDDALSHLSLLQQHDVFYHALTYLRKKSDWWKKYVWGLIRNDEFTAELGRKNLYHYHSNLLVHSRFLPHLTLKKEWAEALKAAFKHFGIKWDCPTANGLPNVYIKRIVSKVNDEKNEITIEKVIAELCKYATKPQDWDNVPIEDIEELAELEKFPDMFGSWGTCRTVAAEMNPKPQEKTVNPPESTINERGNYYSNLNTDNYVHTDSISVPKIYTKSGRFGKPPPKSKQKSWFRQLRDKEITLSQFKIEHSNAVERAIRFRKIQLREKYPSAIFQTLDGQVF